MTKEDVDLKLGKVNGDEEMELGVRNKIRAYPTMLLFQNGTNPIKYRGSCKADALIEWLKDRTIVPIENGTTKLNYLTLNLFLSFLVSKLFL
jgi:thioredoxin-like negative regulator of GroEL